jgi:hypothetical protein
MIHCKACDGSMDMDTVKIGYGDDQVDTGVDEILCNRCLHAARRSEPEAFYEGLYFDKHAHPAHYVMSPVLVDLLTGDNDYDWESTAPDGANLK